MERGRDGEDNEIEPENLDLLKRATLSSITRGHQYATEGPSCSDNNVLDVVGNYNEPQSSSVLSRNGLSSSMGIYVNNASHKNSRDVRVGEFDASSVDGTEFQMDLPGDLWYKVFSFLGSGDLCRAAMVCKRWQAESTHEDLWRSLDFENRNISVAQLEDICHRYPRATEVNLCGNPDIHTLGIRAVSLLRNLESLILGKGQLWKEFFEALSGCPFLKTFVVCDAALVTDMLEISINHDGLQHLQVTKCLVHTVFVRCPQLQSLSLKHSDMESVELNCPLLRGLDIGSCYILSDTVIRSAVISCPLLENLDISDCLCVGDETLVSIALACESLHTLNASYCPNISLQSVRMPLLNALKLESCVGITSASMHAIAYSSMLRVLELDYCSVLTSVSLDLPHLGNLSLVHCSSLLDLNLRCLMLSSLTVSTCPALHQISIYSNALKKLVLHNHGSLNSLSLQCQYLEEVDLSHCQSLMNSVCDVFSEGGGCPMLKSLILHYCEGLTAVELHSTSLVSLSLAGCRAIRALNLTCPSLKPVCFDGYASLERASYIQAT